MRLRALLLILALSSLGACTGSPLQKGPNLVSFADQQRAAIEPAVQGNTYGSLADRLASLAVEAYAGSTVTVGETILNKGGPSKGIRLIVNGTALTQGLFEKPTEATIEGRFEDKSHAPDRKPIDFIADPTGGWHANVYDVTYGSQVNLAMVLPAVRGGTGDLQIYVYPMASNSQGSASVSHTYKVLSETEEPQEIRVPGENQAP